MRQARRERCLSKEPQLVHRGALPDGVSRPLGPGANPCPPQMLQPDIATERLPLGASVVLSGNAGI